MTNGKIWKQEIPNRLERKRRGMVFLSCGCVGVLTEPSNHQSVRNYYKILKNRLKKNEVQTVTNYNRLKILAEDCRMRNTNVVKTYDLLLLI